MAVTIMSGLLVATVLTLMVVPVLFTLLYRIEIP
jgi:multidrug efflux pump subunit AcrB